MMGKVPGNRGSQRGSVHGLQALLCPAPGKDTWRFRTEHPMGLVDSDVSRTIPGLSGKRRQNPFPKRVAPRENVNQSLVPDKQVSGGRFFILLLRRRE